MSRVRHVLSAGCCVLLVAACGLGRDDASEPPTPPTTATPPATGPHGVPATPPARTETTPPAAAQQIGRYDIEVVPEASGLAASRRTPGVLYLLDDGRGTNGVFAIQRDGAAIGRVEIAGLDATDTESLAVAPCAQGAATTCLYVGDIGNNTSQRDTVDVWRVPEPPLDDGPPSAPLEGTVIHLRYPDRGHNAEALLVDTAGTPYIVTKSETDEAGRAPPPRLYVAPGFADGTLADLGTVPLPDPETPLASFVVGNVVTGGDAAPGRVLLRTYDSVIAYVADDAGAPLSAFPSWPVTEVPAAREAQGEAVAIAADGCGYFTVSEGVADIWYVGCAR